MSTYDHDQSRAVSDALFARMADLSHRVPNLDARLIGALTVDAPDQLARALDHIEASCPAPARTTPPRRSRQHA